VPGRVSGVRGDTSWTGGRAVGMQCLFDELPPRFRPRFRRRPRGCSRRSRSNGRDRGTMGGTRGILGRTGGIHDAFLRAVPSVRQEGDTWCSGPERVRAGLGRADPANAVMLRNSVRTLCAGAAALRCRARCSAGRGMRRRRGRRETRRARAEARRGADRAAVPEPRGRGGGRSRGSVIPLRLTCRNAADRLNPTSARRCWTTRRVRGHAQVGAKKPPCSSPRCCTCTGRAGVPLGRDGGADIPPTRPRARPGRACGRPIPR
jgi:hypothetical protein